MLKHFKAQRSGDCSRSRVILTHVEEEKGLDWSQLDLCYGFLRSIGVFGAAILGESARSFVASVIRHG